MRKKIALMIIIAVEFLSPIHLIAQQRQPWEEYLQQLSETEDFESVSWEDYYDFLSDLTTHPMNINTATREDLEQLPFLTAQQVEDILAYLYQYGEMKTINELAMIGSLDYPQRKLLEYFVYAGHIEDKQFPSFRKIMQYGHHKVTANINIPFYRRKGDSSIYRGYPYKHGIRYDFRFSDLVRFGIIGAQDAGEPFFADCNRWGYDYYSFYLQIQKLGKLKNLTLGRYHLQFGAGLIMNNSFGLGKIIALTNLGHTTHAIHVHSSRSEANYLQGATATVEPLHNLNITGFLSYRNIDASFNQDDQSIKAIIKTGYHRTSKEILQKQNATESLVGGNINYFWNGFHIGATGFLTGFNHPYHPDRNALYQHFMPYGQRFWNASIDYGYVNHSLTLQGETATNNRHGIATLDMVSWQINNSLSLMALYRFYSHKYYSFFSNSFSEGGNIQDEKGIYTGINWRPIPHLSLMEYTDIVYFIWPKYGASKVGSHAFDQFFSAGYQLQKWNFDVRYRIKWREKDNQKKTKLVYENIQRCRIAVKYQDTIWCSCTSLNINHYQKESNSTTGYMVSESLRWNYKQLQSAIILGYFHTPDYHTRIYTFEPGMLYDMGFNNYYGRGIRYALYLHTNIGKSVTLTTKIGTTDYFDRAQISSSYQQINHSSKTDMEMQIRWRF